MLHANKIGINVGPYVKTRPLPHKEAKKTRQHLTQTIRLGSELLVARIRDEHIHRSVVKTLYQAIGSKDI